MGDWQRRDDPRRSSREQGREQGQGQYNPGQEQVPTQYGSSQQPQGGRSYYGQGQQQDRHSQQQQGYQQQGYGHGSGQGSAGYGYGVAYGSGGGHYAGSDRQQQQQYDGRGSSGRGRGYDFDSGRGGGSGQQRYTDRASQAHTPQGQYDMNSRDRQQYSSSQGSYRGSNEQQQGGQQYSQGGQQAGAHGQQEQRYSSSYPAGPEGYQAAAASRGYQGSSAFQSGGSAGYQGSSRREGGYEGSRWQGDRGGGGGQGNRLGGGFGRAGAGHHPGEPYNAGDSRQYHQGPQLQPQDVAQRDMVEKLAGRPHAFPQVVPAEYAKMPAVRPGHGQLGALVPLLVNMYRLEVTGQQLMQYDVTFERVRERGGRSRGDADPSAAGPSAKAADPYAKSPDNARDILLHFDKKYWQGRVCWAFDGRRNLIAASTPELLSDEMNISRALEVKDVPVPGKDRDATWKVTFTLTKPPLKLAILHPSRDGRSPLRLLNMLSQALQDGDMGALEEQLQLLSERRQPLEWALKQALMARHGMGLGEALDVVIEVGRGALYFTRNPANRNIGGGLGAIAGLVSGVKLTEGGLMLAADVTSSAFLRTDIDLVQWMADFAGFNDRAGGGGFGGGRGGGRFGGGSGRGGGRKLPEVGPPNTGALRDAFQRGGRARSSLVSKLNRAIKNKKVVYKSLDGKILSKYVAVGFTPEPASRATFFCKLKNQQQQQQQQDGSGDGSQPAGREVSVAEYFEQQLGLVLQYPDLPAVIMKLPKSAKLAQIWIPPECLWFDKNQRVATVTHKGGTEQMIEAARKDPQDLVLAISQAVNPSSTAPADPAAPAAAAAAAAGAAGAASAAAAAAAAAGGGLSAGRSYGPGPGGSEVLMKGLGLRLRPDMVQLQGRILPGPWLVYKQAGAGGDELKALNTGASGQWNMNRFKFSDPADLLSWGLLAVLPRQEFDVGGPSGMHSWVRDLVKRMDDLGLNLGPLSHQLSSQLMKEMVWLPEGPRLGELQEGLREAKERATERTGRDCQLVICFIRDKPSPVYNEIKLVAELAASQENEGHGLNRQQLGLVTQVVVANKTDLGRPGKPNARSQYQANLSMKINAKCGGVNTRWAVKVDDLLRHYFQHAQVPSMMMVFGIDVTHPGRSEGSRSVAALVGSIDRDFGRYAHQVWEEAAAGSEGLSPHKLAAAIKSLLLLHHQAVGSKPGCLLVYRDGVSDSELFTVRRNELDAIKMACDQLPGEGGLGTYRPRVVYMVVQKRHNVRLLKKASPHAPAQNLDPGTVVDSTIVSPYLFDFYLNSHKPLIGTSRAARYVCLLDELGFGADALQVFTYWLCYLYCRCARSVSVVAPVYYAHLLAYRARILAAEGDADSASMSSGSSGGRGGAQRLPEFGRYAQELDGKMFFV